MPFANLSGDPAQDYLADALTRRTDNQPRSHPRQLRHRAQHGHDPQGQARSTPRRSARISACATRSEGSVQPSGDRMRVNAQLIDAEKRRSSPGRTIRHAPRRSIADARRDRCTFGEHTRPSTRRGPGRTRQRTPAANRDAEDLALQCAAAQYKAGPIGKEADAAYALCEQALAIDPNNVRALIVLGNKFLWPALLGLSSDPKATSAGRPIGVESARPRSR